MVTLYTAFTTVGPPCAEDEEGDEEEKGDGEGQEEGEEEGEHNQGEEATVDFVGDEDEDDPYDWFTYKQVYLSACVHACMCTWGRHRRGAHTHSRTHACARAHTCTDAWYACTHACTHEAVVGLTSDEERRALVSAVANLNAAIAAGVVKTRWGAPPAP